MEEKQKKFITAIALLVMVSAWVLWPQGENGGPAPLAAAQSVAQNAQSEAEDAQSLTEIHGHGPVVSQAVFATQATPQFDAADLRTAGEYTDEELIYWAEGTFDTKQDSLRYHFDKHSAELPAETVADYLNRAYETRAEVLENTDDWKVTQSSGPDAAHKYKNYDDARFIILDDDTQLIYSFGR